MSLESNRLPIHDIKDGVKDGLLFLPLSLPLALAWALMAKAAGLSTIETLLWSVGVFAGMSQLASLNIVMLGGGLLEAMVATLLINLRLAFVSLSLASYLRGTSQKVLLLFGFTLSTPSAGLLPARARRYGSIKIYALSAQFCVYGQWVLLTWLGASLGKIIPPAWEGVTFFAAPAAFISLMVPLLADRPKSGLAVALTAGAIGLGLGLAIAPRLSAIIAAVVGASVGLLVRD